MNTENKPQIRNVEVKENPYGVKKIVFTVAPNDFTGDETECVIKLVFIDSDDDTGEESYDTEISINNGDWASLREQHSMVGACIEEFYRLGFDKKFGSVVGE